MKNLKILSVLGIAVLMSACSGEEQEQVTSEEELVKSVNVRTLTIEPSTFASYVRVVGTVETSNDIMISAEVSGKITSYNVDEGEVVRKGATILTIDDAKLSNEKRRLEAATSLAKENYDRLKKVYEDGIGSEIDYLNAKYAYEQSQASLESIEVDLANTVIKAPFTGQLETKMLDVGEMAAPGTPVVRLIGTEDYKITAGVPARYADVIDTGDDVDIWFDTQNPDTVASSITYVANSINPQNRTFEVEIAFPDTDQNFKVDMITNIRLKTNQQEGVLVISEEFVYSKNDQYVVYVATEDEEGKTIAEERVVQLGNAYKTDVIIENGLMQGDQLITLGSAFLDEGMRITVMNNRGATLASN